MTAFDYRRFGDESIRNEYKVALDRAYELGRSVALAYGEGRLPIKFGYVEGRTYNASALKSDDHYLVEIHHSVPLLNILLFSKLLSDISVFPHIDASGVLKSNYEVPAVIDPADFETRANWSIRLNDERSIAALTLADFCTTFVTCHEIGHIVNGHIEGGQFYDDTSRLHELVSFSWASEEVYSRRQAWEIDADVFAITLSMHLVHELFEEQDKHPRLANLFADGQNSIEAVLGVCAATLFAFFCYLKGTRDRLGLQSTHPHPLARSLFVRDVMVELARAQWAIDTSAFDEIYDLRRKEFLSAMEQSSLFTKGIFDSEYTDTLYDAVGELSGLQARFRLSCTQWTWVDWEALS